MINSFKNLSSREKKKTIIYLLCAAIICLSLAIIILVLQM